VISSTPFALALRDIVYGSLLRGVSAGFAAGSLHLVRSVDPAASAALLRVLGLLEMPERGEVLVRDRSTLGLDEAARSELRSRECGFVFAAPFLLAGFTTIENVAMPLFKISQVGPEEARCRTVAALEFVGLGDLIEAPATDLPAASQRRVALARALVHEPAAILIESLDAPLDPLAEEDFVALVRRACRHYGVAVVASVGPAFRGLEQDRILDLAGGAICRDSEAVRGS